LGEHFNSFWIHRRNLLGLTGLRVGLRVGLNVGNLANERVTDERNLYADFECVMVRNNTHSEGVMVGLRVGLIVG
jgi:hypothetical protein